MSKAGGGGLFILGISLVLFGLFIGSGFVEGLLDVLRWIFVVIGIGTVIMGLVKMFSGGGKSSSYSDF